MRFNYLGTIFFVAASLAADQFTGWPYAENEPVTVQAISDGKKRYQQMLDKIAQGNPDSATAVDMCTIQNEWTVNGQNNAPKSASQVSQRLNDFITQASLGIDTSGSNYYKIEEFFPKGSNDAPGDAGTALYELAYNPKDNTIAVVDVNNALTSDVATNRDLTTIGWSTWAQVANSYSGDATKLSSVVHYSCINTPAQNVALDIFGDADGLTYVFEPGSEQLNEPFYALLGLPNGTMAKNLLINFQKTLGYKQLKQIVAWLDTGAGNVMGVSYVFG